MRKIEDTVYPGNVGKKINEKVKAVLERNCGWQDVKKISNIHSGQQQDFDKEGWTIQDILAMKYVPVSSADVDKRLNFTVDNIAAHLILLYNK
ncbi:hypothetical protein M8J77_011126 [Diaphorina citri]|nr:hypothetical protein M8J77_011126 [Diaphorina citri]